MSAVFPEIGERINIILDDIKETEQGEFASNATAKVEKIFYDIMTDRDKLGIVVQVLNIVPETFMFDGSKEYATLLEDLISKLHTPEELTDFLLRDLGLGKETQFLYPWNPSASPDMCENINERKDTDYGLGIYIS